MPYSSMEKIQCQFISLLTTIYWHNTISEVAGVCILMLVDHKVWVYLAQEHIHRSKVFFLLLCLKKKKMFLMWIEGIWSMQSKFSPGLFKPIIPWQPHCCPDSCRFNLVHFFFICQSCPYPFIHACVWVCVWRFKDDGAVACTGSWQNSEDTNENGDGKCWKYR